MPIALNAACDVIVVDATGRPANDSHRLRDALLRRGMKVKLEVVAPPSRSILTDRIIEDVRRTEYCVLLMSVEEGTDSGKRETAYLALPTPPRHGSVPEPRSSSAAGSRLAIGRLKEGVDALAERIATFVERARP
jgi:hypothetical protein